MQGRRIVKTRSVPFQTYDMEGPVQHDMSLLPLSYNRKTGEGAYMVRMEPGARFETHTHRQQEDYIILEGSLIEDDGTVLTPGDYVIMEPGTRHYSRTEEGCLVLGIDWQRTEDPDSAKQD